MLSKGEVILETEHKSSQNRGCLLLGHGVACYSDKGARKETEGNSEEQESPL